MLCLTVVFTKPPGRVICQSRGRSPACHFSGPTMAVSQTSSHLQGSVADIHAVISSSTPAYLSAVSGLVQLAVLYCWVSALFRHSWRFRRQEPKLLDDHSLSLLHQSVTSSHLTLDCVVQTTSPDPLVRNGQP